jgi:hypothetical protein
MEKLMRGSGAKNGDEVFGDEIGVRDGCVEVFAASKYTEASSVLQ